MTSSFSFENAEQARATFAKEIPGNIYSRYSNPSVDEFIQKMCVLEECDDGVAVASGMSAVFTGLASLLESGDHVLASRSVFGSTHQILTQVLPKWGISHSYAPIKQPEQWESLIQANTKLCYVETPSNPALDLIDLDWLSSLCKKHDVILYVDNIFATPILQKPMNHGADLVMHSATKYIDGPGTRNRRCYTRQKRNTSKKYVSLPNTQDHVYLLLMAGCSQKALSCSTFG